MKVPVINLFKSSTTRINSKKEAPKVIAYIHDKPIDVSVSKLTLGMNKIYKTGRQFVENIKNLFKN